MIAVDKVDEVILSALSRDARQDVREIWEFLRDHGFNLTESEIESRITRLEDDKVITRYTISIDTKKINCRIVRFILVKFRTSQHLPSRMEGLKKYLSDAPFVLYSGKTRGGYDWIWIQAFLTEEMADEEMDMYRNLFGDIIQTYEVYDFIPTKEISLQALCYTDKEYKHFLEEWLPPFLGR